MGLGAIRPCHSQTTSKTSSCTTKWSLLMKIVKIEKEIVIQEVQRIQQIRASFPRSLRVGK